MLRPSVWLTAAAIVMISGCSREISGNYIGKFTNGIWWLQLVRTPDNRLTGQLETSLLKPDGGIQRETVAVTGAVNGPNVSMSAKLLGFDVLTLSGTVGRNSLTLTGAQPSPMVLVRSDLNDYQRELKAVNAHAQQIRAAKQAAAARQENERILNDFISRVDQLVKQMQKFTADADVHLGRFPGAEDRYRAITAKMAEYVKRERELSGNPNANVIRGQLDVAANQASIATDQLHNSAQSLQSSFDSRIESVIAEATHFEAGCRHRLPSEILTQAQTAVRDAACESLFQSDGPFRTKVDAVVHGLAHLEYIYRQEMKTQEGLLQISQRLQ